MDAWIRRPIVLLFMVAAAAPAAAQSLTGAVSGVVKDADGRALPGATVSLVGRTGTVASTTDGQGEYLFPAIDPGTYSLRVEMPGFATQRREPIGIHGGTSLAVDFLLTLAGLTETVDVSGASPVVDVSSPAIRNGLSQEMLFNLPFDRFSSDVFNATPGVVGSAASGGSQAFGSGATRNAIFLDGVDSRAPSDGGASLLFNYNVIEDVEVQGLGAPAEYGGFGGGVLNTITRSGGNDFRGLFEARYSNDSLGGDNVDPDQSAVNPSLADPARARRYLEYTLQLGGPIRKDKLFFFVSFQHSDLDSDPSGAGTRQEPVAARLNGKLTWQAGARDHLTVMLQADSFDLVGVPGTSALGDALALDLNAPEKVWSLQWRHTFGSRTLGEVKYLGFSSSTAVDPRANLPAHVDVMTGQESGSAGLFTRESLGRQEVALSLARWAEAYGHHDLKFGVEIERGRDHTRLQLVGGLTYLDYGGVPYSAASFGYDVAARNERESVYLQDAWKPDARLTLTGGLRLDWIRGGGPDVGTVYETTSLAPRLGAAFDVGGDHRSVLKASYGHYYEAAIASFYSRALPGVSDFVVYSLADRIEIGRSPSQRYTVAPGMHHPRTDQITLAFERALDDHTRVSAAVVERRSRNFVDSVQEDARWQPGSVTNLLTGEPLTVYRRVEDSTLPPTITNVDGFAYLDADGNVIGTARARQEYRALMLVVSRSFSRRWQAQASYVWSRSSGTVDNDYEGSIGRSIRFEQATEALVNALGHLTSDPRHELKVLANYDVPRVDVSVGAYFRTISGTHYTPVQPLDGGSPVRLEERGSRTTDTVTLLDLRLEKVFHVAAARHRIGLYADVINVFNANPVLAVQNVVTGVPAPGLADPLPFGAPLAIETARQVVLAVRWSF